jgi:histidinol phosphatase-like enzyme
MRRAARELDVDLTRSWLAGDILDDVEAGNRAGCKTALIHNGGETVWRMGRKRVPTIAAPDIDAASRLIANWAVDEVEL